MPYWHTMFHKSLFTFIINLLYHNKYTIQFHTFINNLLKGKNLVYASFSGCKTKSHFICFHLLIKCIQLPILPKMTLDNFAYCYFSYPFIQYSGLTSLLRTLNKLTLWFPPPHTHTIFPFVYLNNGILPICDIDEVFAYTLNKLHHHSEGKLHSSFFPSYSIYICSRTIFKQR